MGLAVPDELRLLRRLLYCGEWIESHALHIYLLHAPDFLGYPGGLEMAADHREAVERGLSLKRVGNDLMAAIGGRSVHPVNVRVGGFHRLPDPAALRRLRPQLERALDDAVETVRWVAGFDLPEFTQNQTYVSLVHPDDYPMERGTVATTEGEEMTVATFGDRAVETHVAHSHALHAHLDGSRDYVVGPLARYALNAQRLSPVARELAAEVGLAAPCRNPFRSIVVRAVELLHAIDEALRLLDAWEGAPVAHVDVRIPLTDAPAVGHGATEAPRGILYHRYRLDSEGHILEATIVPPTSQNLASMEDDLRRFVQPRLDLDLETLTQQCETAVRNYDPCISCATHFLRLDVVDGRTP